MNRRAGEGSYRVAAPCPTGDLASLLERLHQAAGPGEAVLVGFDFPIGLPARRLLPVLDAGRAAGGQN